MNKNRHVRGTYVKVRPCLWCKKPHQNNNCFCSAECCRAYNGANKHAADSQQAGAAS